MWKGSLFSITGDPFSVLSLMSKVACRKAIGIHRLQADMSTICLLSHALSCTGSVDGVRGATDEEDVLRYS
jgi:hypothetical protein